ncbi:MAG: lipopolysaccharide biosynthesis protein [Tabrizicola sp.]|uniref:GumC family protein n=1 Tax=Tabrizicola sp. TaxID=2005166 RepID=UPI002AB89BC9|nr:lipopolysaccharide biosynthesis protein [Tabrizicola sp.]MDZ4089088.1 lipopolysaccharide biosynthesis protein [Tabrizicola sp.]
MTLDLRFYLSLMLRRLPIILAITITATMAGVLYAISLPPVFRAESRLLIENAQIPDELAASTVRSTADEILLSIQQRILTRENLLTLADRHSLFANAPEMAQNVKLDQIGSRISMYMPTTQGNTGVVHVSFAAGDPELSAVVTNDIAEQILQWNTELRTRASGSTLDFFDQEVRRLTDELSQQNAKILEFEQANRDALPESLEYRRTRQASQQERLLQVNRELASLRDRRDRLTELYDRTGRLVTSETDRSPEQERLEQARQELASALVVLAPSNPRLRALQTEVAALEERVKAQLGASGGGQLSAFEVQMLDIDGQITFLAEQKKLLEEDLVKLEASIEATPGNSIRLAELQNNYETLRVQYEEAVTSLSEARMGDRIEVTDRGQRISVIEKAVPPPFRAEPNRQRITIAALGAGVILSAALLVLLEILNQTVRRPTEVIKALGVAPFGTVGYLPGPPERTGMTLNRVAVLLALLINIPMILLAVHLYVAPLGTLLGFAPDAAAEAPASLTE